MQEKIKYVNPPEMGEPSPFLTHATVRDGFIFVGGQVAMDAQKNVVGEGDPYRQTHATLDNVETVLRACGADLSDIVSATVFLTDVSYAEDYNRAWAERFEGDKPSRATVVAELLLPEFLVEVQAIAVAPDSKS